MGRRADRWEQLKAELRLNRLISAAARSDARTKESWNLSTHRSVRSSGPNSPRIYLPTGQGPRRDRGVVPRGLDREDAEVAQGDDDEHGYGLVVSRPARSSAQPQRRVPRPCRGPGGDLHTSLSPAHTGLCFGVTIVTSSWQEFLHRTVRWTWEDAAKLASIH